MEPRLPLKQACLIILDYRTRTYNETYPRFEFGLWSLYLTSY